MSEAQLHPRPRLTRERWVDLCGTWQFAHDDANQGLDARWQDHAEPFTREIVVPFPPESELSGIGDTGYHPVVWYRRTFAAPQNSGERLILHFGAVDYSARVWVNGQLVATHEGGHSPFSADITTALTADAEQVVVVRAEDQPLDGTMPRGKQDWEPTPHVIWYDRTTGIWQPVWLEPVAATYLTAFHLVPDLIRSTVTVQARLNQGHTGWLADHPAQGRRDPCRPAGACDQGHHRDPDRHRPGQERAAARRSLLVARKAQPDQRDGNAPGGGRRTDRRGRELFRHAQRRDRQWAVPAQRQPVFRALGA